MNKSMRLTFGKKLIELAQTYDFMICNADTKSCGIEYFGKDYPLRNYTFGIRSKIYWPQPQEPLYVVKRSF